MLYGEYKEGLIRKFTTLDIVNLLLAGVVLVIFSFIDFIVLWRFV